MIRKYLFLLSPAGGEGNGKADQADILALNTKLTNDLATANTSLVANQASVTALTTERDAANTALTAAQASVLKLTTDLATANVSLATAQASVTALTESQKSFDVKVASELSKHGIRPLAATGDKTGTQVNAPTTLAEQCKATGMTLTQLCAAANNNPAQ